MLEERALVDDFLGDYEYLLRARMSERSFHEWMRRLAIEPTDDPSRYGAPGDTVETHCRTTGRYEQGVGILHVWCS